jgi:hypothetical protein
MNDDYESLDPNLQWIVSEARRPVTVDPLARARLFEAVRAEPAPRRQNRTFAWLLEPRRIILSPIATAALAAGLVGIGVFSALLYNRDGRAPTERGLPVAVDSQLPDSGAPTRIVKFVLIAPQAAQVSLVGDFNRWDRAATPADREADGTWTVYVPLRPGRHVYSFVLDGTHFVSDPAAPMAPDDGFGHKNSVVVVSGASS